MNNVMYLYGFAGAKEAYRPVWHGILADSVSITTLRYEASMLVARMPNIETVYVVDQRRGLRRDYMNAILRNSVEGYAIFKDLITREGLRVV